LRLGLKINIFPATFEINKDKSKNNFKPPRDCEISFDQNCVPENVFYIVKEGSDILPNTTCPTDNFKNKNDLLIENSSSISSNTKLIHSANLLLITLLYVLIATN
jgi:hypothetical protein